MKYSEVQDRRWSADNWKLLTPLMNQSDMMTRK